MHSKSIVELAAGLRAGDFSSVELTQAYLDRIAQQNEQLNCLITLSAESALEEAAAADVRIGNGEAGPLTGIPIVHKDIFCTSGIRTSCGSRMLDNFVAPYDATVVSKLKAAGTILLGK
ncbi:MAG: amidase family protein, partial [Candidatus Sedimenticola sp. (ex Thyasira tokunagai)]